LYLSYFYKHHELSIRLAFFWTAMSISDVIAAFLAFGLLHMRGVLHYSGWRWLFLIEVIKSECNKRIFVTNFKLRACSHSLLASLDLFSCLPALHKLPVNSEERKDGSPSGMPCLYHHTCTTNFHTERRLSSSTESSEKILLRAVCTIVNLSHQSFSSRACPTMISGRFTSSAYCSKSPRQHPNNISLSRSKVSASAPSKPTSSSSPAQSSTCSPCWLSLT